MVFGRKFNAFCDSYISMLSPYLHGRKYFLIFIKKKKEKKISITIDKPSGIIDYNRYGILSIFDIPSFNATKTLEMIQKVHGESAVHCAAVFRWYNAFPEG